jgi:hypothetical protein
MMLTGDNQVTAAAVAAPVWAMIAMIASVSVVLANSFGTRLRPRSFLLLGRGLGQVARAFITLLYLPRLAALAWRAETAAYLTLVAAAIGAGYAWH